MLTRRAVSATLGLLAFVMTAWVVPAPASAATTIDAKGVTLATSASCGYGDVEIAYDAHGVDTQSVTFSAAGGTTLQDRSSKAYRGTYSGTEHVLAETHAPPAPGSVVAVHVVVGAAPVDTAGAAEFTVVYRCDAKGNEAGGHNDVVWTCFGDLGACPTDADAGLVAAAVPGAVPGAAAAPVAATAVPATPAFTG